MKENIQQLSRLIHIRNIRVALAQEVWKSATAELRQEKLNHEQANRKVDEIRNNILVQQQTCSQVFASNKRMSGFIQNNDYLKLLSTRLERFQNELNQSESRLIQAQENQQEATKELRRTRARLEALQVQLGALKTKQFRQRQRNSDTELEDLVMKRHDIIHS